VSGDISFAAARRCAAVPVAASMLVRRGAFSLSTALPGQASQRDALDGLSGAWSAIAQAFIAAMTAARKLSGTMLIFG
jgi:hypothetical protein